MELEVGAQQCLLGVTQQRFPVALIAVGYLNGVGAGFPCGAGCCLWSTPTHTADAYAVTTAGIL